MKDFEKTLAFVRDFNGFNNLLSELWYGLYRGNEGADHIIRKMREYQKATNMKGEELANEIRDVCPDVLQMRKYFDVWCNILDKLDTAIFYDKNFNSGVQWATKLNDDNKGCAVASMIRRMQINYDDIMDGKRWLETTYSLTPQTKEDQEAFENEETPSEDQKTTVIPHNVLRLFGSKSKYQEYINACKNQCPKEIAQLYKKYGVIQLSQERGIVTTLYDHLRSIGLLTCGKRNFQRHYNQV